ncbi:alpha/beta fold hydrolase [Methylorubrum sp. POS3]|uniref:alpha/beta fold hydrolase n=1 Tax=Methylorubrum sp. POS3 TaxID=2998492 RepID=UPI00372D00C5
MMNRRTILAGSIAAAGTLSLPARAETRSQAVPARNVVLVHGLFADGSCWSDVIGRLQMSGLTVTAVQNPLTTLEEAADSVRRVLARTEGPTVLAGHSFAGTIISEVGDAENVSALVYIAARAPDAGEDFAALGKKFAVTPATAGILFDGDEGRLSEDAFLRDFAGDIAPARARILYAAQQPFRKALTQARTTKAAWHMKPTYYAVSDDDRTINRDLQRFLAKRMDAHVVSLGASHLSLISHAPEVAALIELAARGS